MSSGGASSKIVVARLAGFGGGVNFDDSWMVVC